VADNPKDETKLKTFVSAALDVAASGLRQAWLKSGLLGLWAMCAKLNMASLVVLEAIPLQISILLIGKTIVKRKQDSYKRCSTVLQLIKDYPAS
jgi:hypothetical protein